MILEPGRWWEMLVCYRTKKQKAQNICEESYAARARKMVGNVGLLPNNKTKNTKHM